MFGARKFNTRSGQSLIEILVGVSLGAIIIGGAAGAVSVYLRSNLESKKQQTSTFLAQELMDNVRVFAEGNWHNIYDLNKGSSNHYYLVTSASPFATSTGDEAITAENTSFTRYFYVNNVSRDSSSGDIQTSYATSTDDPSTQKITVIVTWASGGSITLEEYLTRSRSVVFHQTDWSGGGGQETFTTTSSINNQFASSSNLLYSTTGQLSLTGLPPSQITDLAASATSTAVSLTWSAPSDGGSAILYYRIYRGISSGAESLLATTTSAGYTDTGLTNETTYYYQVSAVNAIDEGLISSEVSAMPTVPGGLVWAVSLNPSSSNFEEALAVATSSGAIYVVGYYDANPGSPGTDFGWRMEKRSTTDGSLVWATTTNPSADLDEANAVAADSSYIYIAGRQQIFGAGGAKWLIQKRNQSDGSLVWSITPDQLSNTHYAAKTIAIDSSYVYVGGAGSAVSGSFPDWRIEKRNIADGSIATTTNLVGYWNFNEGNGTFTNDHGVSNDATLLDHGTLTNGPTWTTSSKIGGGLFFDGVDDYVNVTSASGLNPSVISLAAWVKTTDNGANGTVISKTTGCASAGYLIWINENGVASQRPSFWVGNGPWLDAPAGVNVTDGAWHHIAGTYDGSISRLYVDGTERASSTPGAETLSSTTNLQIGESTTCGDPLNGEIDEVRVYDRVLSASEISDLYNATTSPSTWAMSVDTYATSSQITSMTADSSHLYIAGYEAVGASGNEQWRVEKRNISDGTLVWESTTNAGRSGATSSEIAYGVAMNDSYLYVVGYDDAAGSGNAQWKIEQRSKTGAIDDGLTSGRVAHWNFSEGTGTTAGDSSGSNTGTLTTVSSGLPVWTFGQFGSALRFNGTSSYVNIPDSSTIWPTGSQFTLTTWAKVLGTGNQTLNGIVMSKNSTYLSTCYTGSNTPLYSFYDGTTQSLQTGGGPCTANGEWIHLAATWQAGVIARLYVNGNAAGFTSGVSTPADTAAAGSLGRFDGGSYNFNGILDDMRVYNTVLTQTQLQSMYNKGRGVATTTLSNPTSASDIPYGVVVDSSGVYIAGASNGFSEWRIERRNTDGGLVWATTSAATGGNDTPRGITADNSYLYIVGSEAAFNPDEGWRIEKRRK